MFGLMGVLESDGSGDHVRCHVCGEWFVSLASHVRLAHEMTAAEYRAEFGLNKRQALVSPADSERRRSARDLLAKYHHLSPMRDPKTARVGNPGPRRVQHLKALAEAQATPEYKAKMSVAQSHPRPYMAERNRRIAAIKRGQPKPPYTAGEERSCVICGTAFRIKPSHPKICCSPACRSERRRQTIRDRAAAMGRIGGAASGVSKRAAKAQQAA